jgi:hypothetical protein
MPNIIGKKQHKKTISISLKKEGGFYAALQSIAKF